MKVHKRTTNVDIGLKMLVFFIHRYRWGKQIRGDERGFLEKTEQFKKMGATTYVIELEPSLQECRHESIYTSLKIRLEFKTRNPLEQVITLLRLIITTFRLSSKVHYDVIYAYNQDIENVMPAYILKLISKKPLVVVFHLLRSKEMFPLKDAISVRLKKGFSFPSALLASLLDVARRFTYRRADLYISVSDAVKNDIIQYLNVQKVVVARNGVNVSRFEPRNLDKVYEAAFLGRLHPQKGIGTLLRAWKMVVAENCGAKLALIGGGDENCVKHYRDLIHKLKLEENVELTGFVPDEELVRLLNSSKIFVFPSRYDGFALSVAEAMACGLPCIVSDIPALKENYREAAILVRPNDTEGFAQAIMELLRDKERREKLGKMAIECVKKFDWKDVVKKELDAISGLCKGFT